MTSTRFAIDKLDAIDRTDILAHAVRLDGVVLATIGRMLDTVTGTFAQWGDTDGSLTAPVRRVSTPTFLGGAYDVSPHFLF